MNDKQFIKKAVQYYEWCIGSGFSSAKKKYPNILTGFTGGNEYTFNAYEVISMTNKTIAEIKELHMSNENFLDYQKEILESMFNKITSFTAEQIMQEAMYWNTNRFGLFNPTAKDDVKKSLIRALSNPKHTF